MNEQLAMTKYSPIPQHIMSFNTTMDCAAINTTIDCGGTKMTALARTAHSDRQCAVKSNKSKEILLNEGASNNNSRHRISMEALQCRLNGCKQYGQVSQFDMNINPTNNNQKQYIANQSQSRKRGIQVSKGSNMINNNNSNSKNNTHCNNALNNNCALKQLQSSSPKLNPNQSNYQTPKHQNNIQIHQLQLLRKNIALQHQNEVLKQKLKKTKKDMKLLVVAFRKNGDSLMGFRGSQEAHNASKESYNEQIGFNSRNDIKNNSQTTNNYEYLIHYLNRLYSHISHHSPINQSNQCQSYSISYKDQYSALLVECLRLKQMVQVRDQIIAGRGIQYLVEGWLLDEEIELSGINNRTNQRENGMTTDLNSNHQTNNQTNHQNTHQTNHQSRNRNNNNLNNTNQSNNQPFSPLTIILQIVSKIFYQFSQKSNCNIDANCNFNTNLNLNTNFNLNANYNLNTKYNYNNSNTKSNSKTNNANMPIKTYEINLDHLKGKNKNNLNDTNQQDEQYSQQQQQQQFVNTQLHSKMNQNILKINNILKSNHSKSKSKICGILMKKNKNSKAIHNSNNSNNNNNNNNNSSVISYHRNNGSNQNSSLTNSIINSATVCKTTKVIDSHHSSRKEKNKLDNKNRQNGKSVTVNQNHKKLKISSQSHNNRKGQDDAYSRNNRKGDEDTSSVNNQSLSQRRHALCALNSVHV